MIKFVPREKLRLWRGIIYFIHSPGCWMSTLNHFPSSQWSTIFTLAGFLQRGFNDGVPRWMMVANPRYRPGPQKSRCETYLSNCKNSHIMLAPIHQRQVAMTIPSRGQPLSEYAQNCRRKISRQKLCRPRLARQQHRLWFTKCLNTSYLLQLPHIIQNSFHLLAQHMRAFKTLVFIHCSALTKVHLSAVWAVSQPVLESWGGYCRDERDDCLANYAPLARSAKLVTRNTRVTASSHETVCSFEIII